MLSDVRECLSDVSRKLVRSHEKIRLNVGALIVRLGLRGYYTMIITRNPGDNVGIYLGFYIKLKLRV